MSYTSDLDLVWHSSLTLGEEKELERVQKGSLRLIPGDDYTDYGQARLRLVTSIQTLSERKHNYVSNLPRIHLRMEV